MALLVGANLSSSILQLTNGSTLTIGKIFPAIEHISRFDLRSESAQEVLNDSESHISQIAIPQVMGYHEHFISEVLMFAKEHGVNISNSEIRGYNSSAMHQGVENKLRGTITPEHLEIFHILRLSRNNIIHNNGNASQQLKESILNTSESTKKIWSDLTSSEISDLINGQNLIRLNANHIVLAFAITKRIEREVNSLLRDALPIETWAKIAVLDFNESTNAPNNSTKWRKSILGYTKMHYGNLRMSEAQLRSAAKELGFWTKNNWPIK